MLPALAEIVSNVVGLQLPPILPPRFLARCSPAAAVRSGRRSGFGRSDEVPEEARWTAAVAVAKLPMAKAEEIQAPRL